LPGHLVLAVADANANAGYLAHGFGRTLAKLGHLRPRPGGRPSLRDWHRPAGPVPP